MCNSKQILLARKPCRPFVCPALGQGWEGVRSGELFGQDHFPFLGWWYPSSKAMIYRPPHCSAMLGQGQFLWSNVLLRQIISTMYTVHSEAKILFPALHTATCSNTSLLWNVLWLWWSGANIKANSTNCKLFLETVIINLDSNCKTYLSQFAKCIKIVMNRNKYKGKQHKLQILSWNRCAWFELKNGLILTLGSHHLFQCTS